MTTRHKLNINNNININNNKNNNINNTDLLRKSFFTFCRHALASQFWAYVWVYMNEDVGLVGSTPGGLYLDTGFIYQPSSEFCFAKTSQSWDSRFVWQAIQK